MASFFTLTLVLRPYRHAEDLILAASGQLLLVVIFFGAGVLKTFQDVQKAGAEAGGVSHLAAQVYGFDSPDAVVNTLLVFSMAMVILLVAILMRIIADERAKAITDPRWDHTGFGHWAKSGSIKFVKLAYLRRLPHSGDLPEYEGVSDGTIDDGPPPIDSNTLWLVEVGCCPPRA